MAPLQTRRRGWWARLAMWCVAAAAVVGSASGEFRCADGGEGFAVLNDGLCDCQDGSDEPDTSACADNTFHCKTHTSLPSLPPSSNHTRFRSSIPASQVGDGVCDCVDGSDEPDQHCQGHTEAELGLARLEWHEELRVLEDGLRAKAKQVSAGKRLKRRFSREAAKMNERVAEISKQLALAEARGGGGPDVYLAMMELHNEQQALLQQKSQVQKLQGLDLKGSRAGWFEEASMCYRAVLGEKHVRSGSPIPGEYQTYVFEVCPLRHMAQWDITSAPPDTPLELPYDHTAHDTFAKTLLGSFEGWGDGEDELVHLYTEGGMCPNGVRRNVRIEARCASTSALLDVWENGMCEYEGVFATPMACSDDRAAELGRFLGVEPKDEL